MKPALIWCVWYRVKESKGPWEFLYAETDRQTARNRKSHVLYGRDDVMEVRITRHEVEGPK